MLTCPSCGQQNPDGARFCNSCATPLAGEPSLGTAREERKIVTVLFADLVDFTARAELMDPEDVRALLTPYHQRLRWELERLGGTVEKFIGDAVVAVFGAPVAHEDDPERAVRAALAIRDWVVEEQRELQLRIAVATGPALVSLSARPSEGEGIAAGDVVNTAARLQSAAPVNGILVGEQAYRATRDTIEYRPAAPVEAKGKSEPIVAWEALEVRPHAAADLLREPRTPLVGRRRELDLLVSALARVQEERAPQLVTLVGVPGIGKSRLVLELYKTVDQDRAPITWRQGRCLPYGEGVSLWALGEVVKAQAGILESDGAEQAETKLRSAVAEVIADANEAPWIEQQLRPLVGLTVDPGSGERSGETSAWRRFLEGLAEARPLVLVLEDVHWADEGLLEFIDELADRVRDVPLLVLCTARPEFLGRKPGWGGGKANALTISLSPLSDDETARVIAAVLQRSVLEAEIQTELIGRAAGNPLYAEQFARVVTEIGTLDELPETVHGIIAARLDALQPEEKALLQDAAVVGKVFWLGALEAIGDVSRPQAEELLFGLERREFVQRVRRSSVEGEAEYAFRHVLLRDVAYGQLPRAGRSERHRLAAEWIESLGRAEDHAEMRAHHYLSALEYAKAVGREDRALTEHARLALRAAGDRALALASHTAAARFYSAALELWPESDPGRVWLVVHAGRARHAADGTGIDLLEKAFEELSSSGDADAAAEIATDLARCFWLAGERDRAYSWVDRALELGKGRPASRAGAHALIARAGYHMIASEHPEAIQLASEALPLTDALGIAELHIRALDVLGVSRGYSGDAGGLEDSRRAIALARESKAFSHLITAELNLHTVEFCLGQLAAAAETLRAWGRDVERYGTANNEAWFQGAEAHEAMLHGRWDDAIAVLDRLIAETDTGAAHYLEPSWRALRASIELARGDLESASAGSEKALERARRTRDPQSLAPVLTVRGIVLVAQGRPQDASMLVSEALALGSAPVRVLLELPYTTTPIELAWLMRDLARGDELLAMLGPAPSTPWLEATRAIAEGDFARSVELVAGLGAPSVEAYARLRAGEAMVDESRRVEAETHLEQALAFYRSVGANRYLSWAEVLTATPTP